MLEQAINLDWWYFLGKVVDFSIGIGRLPTIGCCPETQAMSACGKHSAWCNALELFEEMLSSLAPNKL